MAKHGVNIDIQAGVSGGEKLENLRREMQATARSVGTLSASLGNQELGAAGRVAASVMGMLSNPIMAVSAAIAAATAAVTRYLNEIAQAQAERFDQHLERTAQAAKSYEVALGGVIKALERKAEIERAGGLSDTGTQAQIGEELSEGANEAAKAYATATDNVLKLSKALQEAKSKSRFERAADQLFGGLSIKELERRLQAAQDAQSKAYDRIRAADEALATHTQKAQVRAAANAKKSADEQAQANEQAALDAQKAWLDSLTEIQRTRQKEKEFAKKLAREKLDDAQDKAKKEVDAAKKAADEKIKAARAAADEAREANKALAEMPTIAQIGSRSWQKEQRAMAKEAAKEERRAMSRIDILSRREASGRKLSREGADMLRQAREREQAEQRAARAAAEQQAAGEAADAAKAKADEALLSMDRTLTELADDLKKLLRQE